MRAININRESLILKINPRIIFYVFLSLIWSRFMIVDQLTSIAGKIIDKRLINLVLIIGTIVLISLASKYLFAFVTKIDILFAIIVITVYVFTLMFKSGTYVGDYLTDNIITILIANFGMYFIGLCANDNKAIDILHWFSLCFICLFSYYLLFHLSTFKNGQSDEFMGYAYLLLPHLCLTTGYFFNSKKLYDLLALMIGSILLIACGSRGPVLLFICYIIVLVLELSTSKRKWYLSLLLAIVSLLLFFNYDKLVLSIKSLMTSMGLSTRIIDMIISNSIFIDRGRSAITNQMLELIRNKPFLGYGLAGDRGYSMTAYSNTFEIAYAHNIVLEFWVSFGIVLGSFLLLYIIKILFNGYFSSNNNTHILILSLLFSNGFFYLFMSGSYLLSPNFFFLIGLCIAVNRNKQLI